MTETMKKTDEAIARFKPPFEASEQSIWDADGKCIVSMVVEIPGNREEGDRPSFIAQVLNFYYANQRERSERKGEKE